MPSLTWYVRRLQCMSVGELAWRLRSEIQVVGDRLRVACGAVPSPGGVVRAAARGGAPGEAQTGPRDAAARSDEQAWVRALKARSGALSNGRLSVFGVERPGPGKSIDWHLDYASGTRAPLRFSPAIDYRDTRVAGDCKLVWEPNRHHQLVVLGRAYRVTSDPGYAEAVVEQLQSWLDQNPFGRGMNWRSPLELGIRLINWVWTVDLIRDAGVLREGFRERLLHAAYLHIWDIQRKYSRGSSANNHLVGEAAGVYIGACGFPELALPERWRSRAREILESEIVRQTHPDGCTREQAFGYHLFVIQFFLLAGLAGRRAGEEFSATYWRRLEQMIEFAGLLSEGGRAMPMVGDADDGYVLDLGSGGMDPAGIFSTAAILFKRGDFRRWAGGFSEMPIWLLGRETRERFDRVAVDEGSPLASRAFPESGYYLLQSGVAGSPERISVLFDCGELGFGSIAAHGHADALSIVLRAFGTEVLVDPGTYDYFTYPEWRRYFRSTRAHNTLVVDGQDQSVMLGPFLWGTRATARCVAWQPSPSGGVVVGQHDGYARLRDPVLHRRRVELKADERTVVIRDEIEAAGAHTVEGLFHLGEECTCTPAGENRFAVETGGGRVVLELDPGMTCRVIQGGDAPGPGWVSRGYHRKVPTQALLVTSRISGSAVFEHRVVIGPPVCR